jgi:hypothetical protein
MPRQSTGWSRLGAVRQLLHDVLRSGSEHLRDSVILRDERPGQIEGLAALPQRARSRAVAGRSMRKRDVTVEMMAPKRGTPPS